MANQPLFSVSSGAISGAVWSGQYGPQPSIKKAKRTKEGKFEKDENGKQVYTEYYGKADMLHVAFVATSLYNWMTNNPEEKKTEPEF